MAGLRLLFVMAVLLAVCNSPKLKTVFYKSNDGVDCIMCGPGQYVKEHCSVNGTRSTCDTCPDGTYNPSYTRATSCIPCKLECRPTEEVVTNCTRTSDLECKCKEGLVKKTYDDTKQGYDCLNASRPGKFPSQGEERETGTGSRYKPSASWIAILLVMAVTIQKW